MSIILINLLVGPPLFRFALIRVGEVKASVMLPTKEAMSPAPSTTEEAADKSIHSRE